MKKFLVGLTVFITIVLFVLIQVNFLNSITFAGTIANIGIILVVSMGLMCDKGIGKIIGLVYGLLIDIVSGKIIGFYLLLYMLLGYVCGKIGRGFSKENKTTLIVIVGIATIVFEILTYILLTIINNYDNSIFTLLLLVIKEAIYNILIGLILFKPLSLLGEIINKSKDSYYLL